MRIVWGVFSAQRVLCKVSVAALNSSSTKCAADESATGLSIRVVPISFARFAWEYTLAAAGKCFQCFYQTGLKICEHIVPEITKRNSFVQIIIKAALVA